MSGEERARIRVESFVSGAHGGQGGTRLELTPASAGRYRVRFALTGRQGPTRLALGRLERADHAWCPADIWYPGQMVIRWRRVTLDPNSARLALTAVPVGRGTRLRQSARAVWPPGLSPSARRVAAYLPRAGSASR